MKSVPGFVGVFSSDHIPLLTEKNSSLILNFDERIDPGSHFIAIFKSFDNKCYYFDPLQLNFLPSKIGEYLYKYNSVYDLSKKSQSFESTYCGFYCILFIICLNIGKKYWEQNIVPVFKSRSKLNDKICIDLICKSIKILSKNLKRKIKRI